MNVGSAAPARTRSWRAAFVCALLLVSCAGAGFDEGVDWPRPTRGAVVCEHPLATAVGIEILERGGNAADAAVATALALAVVYPQAGNLGGGGFALWVPHELEPETIDFRETAPSGAWPEAFLDESGQAVAERSLGGPLSVAVPGSPAGLWVLLQRHGSGRLSLLELARPAIELAEQGFEVDPWLARDLGRLEERKRLREDPAAAALFYPNGQPLREGALLQQPELALCLRRYARGGPEAFYTGPIAEAIVAAVRDADERAGGIAGSAALTLEDLAAYEAKLRPPLVAWFQGSQIIGMGPPSSGGITLLQILAMLEGFPLDAERRSSLVQDSRPVEAAGVSALALHWWIEAMRRAFADRAAHLGDPDFHPVPVSALLAPDWIARRRISIGKRADTKVEPLPASSLKPTRPVLPIHPAPPVESDETTHLSVVDRWGNAVSLTTTLNASFGSGILVPEAGFLLNDEIDDFAIQAGTPNLYGLVGGEANAIVGGKRPLSSMTPIVVRDGGRRVSLVLGSPGGPRIITAVLQVLLRVLVYGQDLGVAVRAPRLHQQWSPESTRFEAGWPIGLVEALRREHAQPVEVQADKRFGSVQGIVIGSDGEPSAVSDPRRGGSAQVQGEQASLPAHPSDGVQSLVEDAARARAGAGSG